MPLQSGKAAHAKKIKGSLFAAFPDASPPLVWKFDLEKNHSFTLTLQGEEGDWELGVTSPRGEFYPVARFLARDDAEEAFIRTQRALLRREYNFWRIAGPICVAILVLSTLMSFLAHIGHSKAQLPAGALSQTGVHESGPVLREGVPVPADQVLVPPP